jgi:hypothetical protein
MPKLPVAPTKLVHGPSVRPPTASAGCSSADGEPRAEPPGRLRECPSGLPLGLRPPPLPGASFPSIHVFAYTPGLAGMTLSGSVVDAKSLVVVEVQVGGRIR